MAQLPSAVVGVPLSPAAKLYPSDGAISSVLKREACPSSFVTAPATSAAGSEAHFDKLARLLKPRPLANKTISKATASKTTTSKPASSSSGGSFARAASVKAAAKTATGKRARNIGNSRSLARSSSMKAAAQTLMSIKKGLGLSTKRTKKATVAALVQNNSKTAVTRVHPPPVTRVHPPPVTRVHPPPVTRVHPPPVTRVHSPPVTRVHPPPAGTPPMFALGRVAASQPTTIKMPPPSASPMVAAAATVQDHSIFNTMRYKAANAIVFLWEDGVEAIVDTGSSATIISKSLVENMGVEHLVQPVNISMTVASGGSSALLGSIRVPITLAGTTMEVTAYVTAAAPYKMLLGMDWLAPTGSIIDLGRQVVTIVPKQCSAPLFYMA